MSRPSLDAFLSRRAADRRLARLTHDVVLPVASGLEIGACANPLLLPEGVEVAYVDHDRCEATNLPGGVAVDHVWAGSGSLAELCGAACHDFVVACQVAQYVPNLLGWFRGIHEVLRVNGVLNLSLPDRRFMFDAKRHPSTLGEAVEADIAGYARPSVRQVFDHTYGAVGLKPASLWVEDVRTDELPRLCGEHALALAQEAARKVVEEDRYVPCHCWVFSPLSFLDLVEGASRLRLFPLVISQFSATEAGECEFFVCLRRDAEEDPERLLDLQMGALSYVRTTVEKRHRAARLLGGEG